MKENDRTWAEQTLEYTREWFESGILTDEILHSQRREWSNGVADPNTEHFRYRAWRSFWMARNSVSNQTLGKCIALAAKDADPSLGNAILHDMLKTDWLSDEQFLMVRDELKDASAKKIGQRYALLRSVKADPSPENLDRIVREGHSGVQRHVIDSYPLKRSTLEFLEAHGAAREIRNLARQELRRREASD